RSRDLAPPASPFRRPSPAGQLAGQPRPDSEERRRPGRFFPLRRRHFQAHSRLPTLARRAHKISRQDPTDRQSKTSSRRPASRRTPCDSRSPPSRLRPQHLARTVGDSARRKKALFRRRFCPRISSPPTRKTRLQLILWGDYVGRLCGDSRPRLSRGRSPRFVATLIPSSPGFSEFHLSRLP